MEDYCLLCNRLSQLQLSHVLPAFTFRWQKKSGSHIRHSATINQRVQDGAKEYWLCVDCEHLFNEWETKFANAIFHPTNVDGVPSISYGDWLLKFCASVSWRCLLHLRQQTALAELTPEQRRLTDQAQKTWAEFIRGEREHPGVFEQHLVPFGPVTASPGTDLPPNINRYLLRVIEIDFARSASTMFVYSKFGRFAILGFEQLKYPKRWVGSKVRLRGGTLKPREYVFPTQFGEYLADRARRVWVAMDRISEPQHRKIDEAIRSDFDRFANTDLFKAIQLDVEMFGRAAFRKSVRK
jgi:hypothetical protein